jgi:DNA mismatch repair protein MutS2
MPPLVLKHEDSSSVWYNVAENRIMPFGGFPVNDRVLRVLEYHAIIEKLKARLETPLGLPVAEQLGPATDWDRVLQLQQETSEGGVVLRKRGAVPFEGVRDVEPAVRRAAIGGNLTAAELVDIADTVKAASRLRRFLEELQKEADLPRLGDLAGQIAPLRPLEDTIRHCIDEHGEMKDTASDSLRAVRQQIRTQELRLRERLEAVLRAPHFQKMFQDPLVTLRSGRHCIPVKAEYKGSFPGIVHDQSASGATLFIEPASVVPLHNRLRELQIAEQREIERILARLSREVESVSDDLARTLRAVGQIDFIMAKAGLALDMNASPPRLNREGRIVLKRARHPLIDHQRVVPVDVMLGGDVTLLVITGPNTGGKTVTLKTVGLLTLMAMSGLHVPAAEESELAVFREVFADIGDEQSIQQNLSTFSGHLKNIVSILREAGPDSLVLLDELGAGTDPTEGAALAVAILDFLRMRAVPTIATTHFGELKAYAYSRPKAMNASVEFDLETLQPTYRLLMGVPGRSNAFAIAERLGLPREIVEAARAQLSSEDVKVDDLLRQLETVRREAEKDRDDARRVRREAEELLDAVRRRQELFEQEQESIRARAEREARDLIARAERQAEETIAALRKMAEERQESIKEHQLIELRKRLQDAKPELYRAKGKPSGDTARLRPGDTVEVVHLRRSGTVLEAVGESQFVVQIGVIKMKLDRQQLRKVNERPASTGSVFVRRETTFGHAEIDVRGCSVDEAVARVDRFLDEAVMNGYQTVTLIHGKGTGTLGAGIQRFLKGHPQVRQFRYGVYGEGGTGVTIVELGR